MKHNKPSAAQVKFFKDALEDMHMDDFNDAKRFKQNGVIPEHTSCDGNHKILYRSFESPTHDVIVIDVTTPFENREGYYPGEIGITMVNTSGTYKDSHRECSDYYCEKLFNAIMTSDLSVDPVKTIGDLFSLSVIPDEVKEKWDKWWASEMK